MMRPAREVLRLPSARRLAVEEKTTAAAAPRCPRSHASSGTRRRSKSSHGWAKENPQGEFWDQKLGRFKRTSFYELTCFIEQEPAVFSRRVVTRELDQVAAVQEIAEERLFIRRKRRGSGERVEEFHRSLPGDRQLVLLRHVTPQDIGHADAELIRCQLVPLGFGSFQEIWRAWPRGLHDDGTVTPAFDQPNRQTGDQQQAGDCAKDHPRLEEKVI